MSSESKSLLLRLEHLELRCERAEQQCEQTAQKYQALYSEHVQSQRQYRQAARRLRVQGALACCAVVGAILLSPASRAALAQGYGVTLQQLQQQVSSLQSSVSTDETNITALQNKTQFMSADAMAKSTTFSGCNLYINNGLGATNNINGLGNLIIGYNEGASITTGSHNLILGGGNSYSSYGGIVAGLYNTISAPFASVTGGHVNTASGPYSCIYGGYGNTASDQYCSVTGGFNNTASAFAASVSGGSFNTASGDYSSISGGVDGKASGGNSSISGGVKNTASGEYSSISGGGNYSVGGITVSTDSGWAAGSQGNTAFSGNFSSP